MRKKASICDLQIRTSELVRAAAAGDVIFIERRGKPMTELRPQPKEKPKLKVPGYDLVVAGDAGHTNRQHRHST